MKSWLFAIPLALFAVLVFFLWRGLALDPHEVPSPLIGRPAPSFSLPAVLPTASTAAAQQVTSDTMKGRVWLLNVWGSWCVSCRAEHPVLLDFAKTGLVPVVGLNWKDAHDDAVGWLRQFGDPYLFSAADLDGRVAINYGVYGAPETFVIDQAGVIRYKVIGPLTPAVLANDIVPLVRKLQS
jgi:cytochrome c biogenesis protein CcmG/thiol:disulfide interchange protein DsbE